MTFDQFISSLEQPSPPDPLKKSLAAMWFDGKGDWDAAHDIAQDLHSSEGSWIHAYLHRKEGDESNAAYWYRRAGKPIPRGSLHEEWEEIVSALLPGRVS